MRWWKRRRRRDKGASDVKAKLNEAAATLAAAQAQVAQTQHKVRRANAVADTALRLGERNGFYDLWAETFQLKER